MAADRRWPLALLFLCCVSFVHAQSLLGRQVEVHAAGVKLSKALDEVAHAGGFRLSYNATAWPVDSVVTVHTSGTVKDVLGGLLGRDLVLKETGAHVILLREAGAKRRFDAHGSVVDGATGTPMARVAIVELNARNSTVTDTRGSFTLRLSGVEERPALLFSRTGYSDTVLFIDRSGEVPRVVMHPHERLETLEPLCSYDRCDVEDLGVARLLVADRQLQLAEELDMEEEPGWQISVWPGIGTHKELSGMMVNKVSFNLLAGYSRGLEGAELGLCVNMERRDVNGFQLAGLANLVGRNTNGVQLAGALNHTMRSFKGLQLSGLGNTVWDTLTGAQISGGANVVKGGMQGAQIVGGCNVTTKDCDGVQIAGGVNVAVGDVHKTQVAGGLNYARNVAGVQLACGMNVALGAVGGGQIGCGANYARSVTGGQVTVGLNVAVDTVQGGQVGTLNFARISKGGQVGILNICDTITGTSVGLLSVAWRGYHRFDVVTGDVMALSLHIRTGTRAFHNILGYSPMVTPDERWGFLYGFGTEPRIGGHGFLNIDLTGEQVVEQRDWVDALNILGRFSVSYGYRLPGPLVVSVGPVLNMHFTDWRNDDTGEYLSQLAPSEPPMEWISGTTRISGWFGWKAALGLSF